VAKKGGGCEKTPWEISLEFEKKTGGDAKKIKRRF